MSDTSQGEGWWQASDGKWYPPQQAEATLPPPPPSAPGTSPTQSEDSQTRETATTALMCGIVGLCISWIPLVGLAGLILGVIAVALGFIKRKTHKVKAPIILGALAIIVSTIVFFALKAVVDEFDECFDAIEYDLDQFIETGEDPDTAAEVCD